MPTITTPDGVEIYYVEHGTGRPIVLSHGWPLNSDAWQLELKVFADAGYRVIAHDRRGHGRSSATYTGNDIDTYARDLSALVETLDLNNLVVLGHSTGGGEVVHYAAEYGRERVSRVVTVGAVPPVMVRSEANPDGLPIEVFDGIRAGVLADRSQFWKDLSESFYGANHGRQVSAGLRDDFWRMGMQADLSAAYDCVKAFSETDFTEDLKALEVPILIAHGDDDQIVPVHGSALRSMDLVKHGTLRIYQGAPHGIHGDYQQQLHRDVLSWLAD